MILETPGFRECWINKLNGRYATVYVQRGTSDLAHLVKIFIVLYQITWLIMVILILYIDMFTLTFFVYFNIILNNIHM